MQKLKEIEKRQFELRAKKNELISTLTEFSEFRPLTAKQKFSLINPVTLTSELTKTEIFAQLYSFKCLYLNELCNLPYDLNKLNELKSNIRALIEKLQTLS